MATDLGIEVQRRIRSARILESVFSVTPLALGLVALLALGWDRSPFRLHAATSAIWAVVAAGFALIELRRATRDSQWWFLAAVGLSVSFIALVASLVVLLAFTPCGGRCV